MSRQHRKGKWENFDGRESVRNLGAGDTFYIHNFIKTQPEKMELFEKLFTEVDFQQMFHFVRNLEEDDDEKEQKSRERRAQPIPRMVTAQTSKESHKSPIYRMPGCNEKNIPTSKWTKTVDYIRKKACEVIQQDLNHCVLTLFRDNQDSLGLHQDKVLDLKDNSLILSISFGAVRPIIFELLTEKKKHSKHKQRIMLQSGSLLAIGPLTNERYRHSIPKVDYFVLPRISLSFRLIDTFQKYHNRKKLKEESNDDGGGLFQIVGKGEKYQCKDYPFITSYPKESQWSDESKLIIRQCQQESKERLQLLKKTLFGSGNGDSDGDGDVRMIDHPQAYGW